MLVASRGRQLWYDVGCAWLAEVVSSGTTSVVLVARRGRQLWYDVGCAWLAEVVSSGTTSVANRGRLSSLLRSGPWSLKPAVVSGRSAHPGLAAPSCYGVEW